MLANEALSLELERAEVASLCARAEGHPDNAGAVVFGGAVLSIKSEGDPDGAYVFSPLKIHPDLRFVFAVPDLEIETSAARSVLPSSLPYSAAISAIAKAASLVRGLGTSDAALLAYALEDVVHVPFRRELVPGYDAVVFAAVSAGAYGATLSGSGSTIVALVPHSRAKEVGVAMQEAWRRLGRASEVIVGSSKVDGASSTSAD
jgi:homoserine kinase